MANEVFAAKPEIPEILRCAPSGPMRYRESTSTRSFTRSSSSAPWYISIYPHGTGFWIEESPNASEISSLFAKQTVFPLKTGI